MPHTNTTHISSSESYSNTPESSHSSYTTSDSSSNAVLHQNFAGNLYYGLGRFLRSQWDYLYKNFWQVSVLSAEEIAAKQQAIYIAGLKECIEHLKPALENVRKNPNDSASLGKIDELAQHYAAYVNVAASIELNMYQRQYFQPINEQVEQLANSSLKRKLKTLLPILTMQALTHPANQKQDDAYSLALSQSYYGNENSPKRGVEQALFPAVFNLSELDGNNGFVIPGVVSNGYFGYSVNSAGDINADNITDLVVGATGVGANNGAVYVIYGSRKVFPPSFNLTNLNGTNGFTITGVATGYLGVSVSTAGDFNGDNITDLIVGANSANSGFGAGYVIFGNASGFPASFNVNTLNGANGFAIPGIAPSGYLGVSVSTAGDINGDMISDIAIGAYYSNINNGVAYVVFGNRSGFSTSFNLNTFNGNGFSIPGVVTNGHLGNPVNIAGDINGDGISDLLVGAQNANANNGAAYVIFGTRTGFSASFNLTALNGTNGFAIPGVAINGQLGVSNRAGDVNGDGIDDLILGASGVNANNGAAYLIFGTRSGFSASFNLTALNGTNGFTIPGVNASGLGGAVATAGDVNGDGISDLVLGAGFLNANKGGVYVIFGTYNGFPAFFNLSNLDGTNGFTVPGIAPTGYMGISASAKDVNGDGVDDLIIGANNANSGLGASYVIFGKKISITPTPTPTPSFSTPTPTPTPAPSLPTACPSTQPLRLASNNIDIIKGQRLRLVLGNLFPVCGNSTVPNLNTQFALTNIVGAQVQTRNSSNIWNSAFGFFAKDIANNNVDFIHDGSDFAPILNLNLTDGATTLSISANITFHSNNTAAPEIGKVILGTANNTIILNANQFPIVTQDTSLNNLVITVEHAQGGQFTRVDNASNPVTDFTYYQLQHNEIQFVPNGTSTPNITLGLDDGLGHKVLFTPVFDAFQINNSRGSSVSIGVILGATAGIIALAGIACGLFYHFIFRPQQQGRLEQYEDTLGRLKPATR